MFSRYMVGTCGEWWRARSRDVNQPNKHNPGEIADFIGSCYWLRQEAMYSGSGDESRKQSKVVPMLTFLGWSIYKLHGRESKLEIFPFSRSSDRKIILVHRAGSDRNVNQFKVIQNTRHKVIGVQSVGDTIGHQLELIISLGRSTHV